MHAVFRPRNARPPSQAMVQMLRRAQAGRPLTEHASGRSEHGGATWSRVALVRRGLLVDDQLSAAGAALLAEIDNTIKPNSVDGAQ